MSHKSHIREDESKVFLLDPQYSVLVYWRIHFFVDTAAQVETQRPLVPRVTLFY